MNCKDCAKVKVLTICNVLGAVVMDMPDGILTNQLPELLTRLEEDVCKAPCLHHQILSAPI